MAERKTSRGASGGTPRRGRAKAKTGVIDVGEEPAEGATAATDGTDGDADEEQEAGGEGDGLDADLASAQPIDVGEEPEPDGEPGEAADVDEREVVKPSRGGSLARRDPMAVYMSETRRYPLLTPDEEHDLAVRLVEQHDTVAARRLIEANLRLVVKIAYEYRRAHKNLLDLVQEGNIGLIQAVGKFDPYRGVKLSSYAAFWIRAYILKFVQIGRAHV